MKKNKFFVISFLASIPWITMSIGGFLYTKYYLDAFLISICSVAIIFFFMNRSIKIDKLAARSCDAISPSGTLLYKIIYISIFAIFVYYFSNIYEIASRFNFNLALARTFYFRSDIALYDIFGSVYIRMIYSYIVVPSLILFILFFDDWKKEEFLIIFFFLLSTALVGGRFGVYYIFLIYSINSSFKESHKIYSLQRIAVVLFCFVFVFVISLNRVYYLNTGSFVEHVLMAIKSIWRYHSVQLGILSSAYLENFSFGPLTGLITPFFVLISQTSPEGEIASLLDETIFFPPSSTQGYNAFGTSIAYFYGDFGTFGIILFFISIVVVYFIVNTLLKDIERKVLFIKYCLLSFFFSGFMPFMFNFSWWFSVLMISFFPFTAKNIKRK